MSVSRLLASSAFTLLSAVEIWDAAFRWREQGQLRDLTIDDTWARVAGWVTRAEPGSAEIWNGRFATAFARWALLPDEVLLESAGTGAAPRFELPPLAVVNAAAFVHGHRPPRMDLEGFAVAAGLAVRLLDNALVVAGHAATRQVRVGLIGMADALERLGIAYASPAARQSAAEMARMLLHGSLHGAMDLTMERGGGQPVASRELARLQQTGVDPGVLSAMARHGLRRLPLVGLFGAPRLARLANSLAEATDPVRSAPPMIESRSTLDANGTSDLLRGGDLLAAQLQLRAAMQPWFVTPIEQPLVVSSIPADEEWQDTLELASRLGLPPPSWHQVDSR